MGIKAIIRRMIKVITITEKIPVMKYVDKEHLLEGKVALVTGGSSGIGLEIARAFTDSGCKVIIAGTNKDKLLKAAEKLPSGGTAYSAGCNKCNIAA